MAFDQPTRNRLQSFVGDARVLLVKEFTRQLQNDFGLNPEDGSVTPVENLGRLDDARRQTAQILRETLAHYAATMPSGSNRDALERIVREQAFTVLNRLAALRMAEARDFLIESIGQRYNSKGFQLYARLAGTGLGETGDAYRAYVLSLFDEFAVDLAVLFDRFSPYGQLFPREAALLELLGLLNDPELASLWAEDETIGWIYQYFNSKEERKTMRDASAAPRNSRELAVRNQFFTPRYVVEFLTDNTLGRIWYEMTHGQTRLKDQCRYLVRRPNEVFLQPGKTALEQPPQDNLTQEQVLQQTVYIPHRPLKDPREIRMLDPACGSMHFGLYSFDLFEAIYDEAWEIAHDPGDLRKLVPSFSPFVSFVIPFSDKPTFLTDVPRLIIEHNIHGIDIDPRAVQIAGLSLWLRAQRSWQQQGLGPQGRPRIRRSNIVCAEPMPGEEQFLDEFIDEHLSSKPELKLLGQLVRRAFEAMKLAGEAGSLLKIEEEIGEAVTEAKQKWLAGPQPEQLRLFAGDIPSPVQGKLSLDVTGITDETFWGKAEERIYAALKTYAEQAEHNSNYQRRLFADDAGRGFAFIDLCRKHYDAVLMNPPFGQGTPSSATLIKTSYKRAAFDVFACFLERGLHLLNPTGSIGAITTSAGFYRNQIEDWRASFFLDGSLRMCADLGGHVLDGATVRAATYVRDASPSVGQSVFVRCNESDTKGEFLLSVVLRMAKGQNSDRIFAVDTRRLNDLPGRPLAYWLPTKFQQQISTLKRFADSNGNAQFGLSTKDDFRFLRLAWEVPPDRVGQAKAWCFTSKGGLHSSFYYDIHLLTFHEADFRMLEQSILAKYPYLGETASWVLHRENNYYQAGITFQRRTNKPLAPRVLPAGCLFTDNGPSAFWTSYPLLAFLGLFNSSPVRLLAAVGNGALEAEGGGGANSYEVGVINNIVVPALSEDIVDLLSSHSAQIIELKRSVDVVRPETRVFISPLSTKPTYPASQNESIEGRISFLTERIDELVNPLYGFTASETNNLLSSVSPDSNGEEEHSDPKSSEENRDLEIHDSVSWELGCALGRWDITLATNEKPVPELPDPFAALPICPPGQLQNELGLPLTEGEVERLKEQDRWHYPLEIPWDGIFVDERGHPLDIEARLQQVLAFIWKDRWETVEREACEILSATTLRDYLCKPTGFFEDHLKRYTKSRRQAPIYWPLSTASGSYTLWLYYHRLNDQTLYMCVNEFVDHKLRDINDTLAKLRTKGSGRNPKEDEKIEQLHEFGLELKEFREEVLRLANLPWKPNLNDGVQITAAPLWKLFRLPKWRKTLKETWEKLEKGDYDWAHLAYSIWSERVREKCKTDKSVAIAHGLEELYVEPPTSGKIKRARRPRAKNLEETEEV